MSRDKPFYSILSRDMFPKLCKHQRLVLRQLRQNQVVGYAIHPRTSMWRMLGKYSKQTLGLGFRCFKRERGCLGGVDK